MTKQVFSDKDMLEKTLVEINSPQLLTALKELVKYYPAEPLQFEKQATFEDPFMLLNHYVPELQAYKQKTDDDAAKEHIDLLIGFLESEAGEKGQEAKRLVASSLITFDLLWVIFKPGELMYESKHGHERLYQLQRTGYGETNERGRFFEVSCGYTNSDGVRSGRSSTSLRIWERNEFVGQSPSSITGLSIFPLRFRDQQDELKDRLVQRGKQYLDIRGVTSYDYEGLFLYLKQPPEDFYSECATYEGTWLPRTVSSNLSLGCLMADMGAPHAVSRLSSISRSTFCPQTAATPISPPISLCIPHPQIAPVRKLYLFAVMPSNNPTGRGAHRRR